MSRPDNPETCRRCGGSIALATDRPLRPRFCPWCGAPLEARSAADPAAVTEAYLPAGSSLSDAPTSTPRPQQAGPRATAAADAATLPKKCGYCQSPLDPRVAQVTCPYCRAPHHEECWTENGGCTVYGCRGQSRVPVPAPAAVPNSVGRGSSPVTLGQGPLTRRRVCRAASESLFFGTLAVLLAIVGIGLVFGPLAIHRGQRGLRQITRDRQLRGRGRAWTGQTLGLVGALLSLTLLVRLVGCKGL